MASSVLHHHHWDVIRSGATGAAFATTAAGRTGQSTLPLERFQEEGFIDLDDTLFPCRLMGCHGFQEAVTPQEGGVFADPAAEGSLSDGKPVDECLGVVLPALGLAQSGHGRLGQDGTGALTLFAAITAQPSAPAPGGQLRGLGLTVGATSASRTLNGQRGDGMGGREFMLRETTLAQGELWEERQ
ncbi:hypothetical protein D3C84_720750 [compost metagenome]